MTTRTPHVVDVAVADEDQGVADPSFPSDSQETVERVAGDEDGSTLTFVRQGVQTGQVPASVQGTADEVSGTPTDEKRCQAKLTSHSELPLHLFPVVGALVSERDEQVVSCGREELPDVDFFSLLGRDSTGELAEDLDGGVLREGGERCEGVFRVGM